MRTLVTGGRGFLGKEVCKLLPDAFVPFDYDMVKWPSVDVVIHLSGMNRIMDCYREPVKSQALNVTRTVDILQWCREREVKRIVYGSSCVLYSGFSLLRAAKLAAEEYCTAFAKSYDMSIICLRYSNFYGKGLKWDDQLMPAEFRRQAKDNGKIVMNGDGSQLRDFLHVSDAAVATVLAAKSDWRGILDICTGRLHSVRQFAEAFGVPVEAGPQRMFNPSVVKLDPQLAEQVLGWHATIDFEDGVKEMAC